ncbi:hypothetical protein COLO4_14217 [Corchorus olitorius]|uniref:BHLH domain-containing protein n=1 Tax=Corchorus olitorius TaxID=93759 RepID=A0A1R3JT66_9ROSI|nr:hypothetical protein COLO4_14217 [Corchorus olitorius]
MGKGRRLKKSAPIPNNDGNGETNDAKKMMRKEIERQRRQQMANLSAQLRSLLPVDSIKGKRAVSDHMNEAVNYIKYLRKRIQELSVKREKLKKLSGNFDQGTSASATSSSDNNNSSSQINCVAIHPYWGGVEIVINSGFGDESCHLSLILQAIIEQGLDVVRCVSSQTSEGFCHTIQSEISDPTLQLDLPGLQSRINDLIL